jgi:hypothetical protein
MQFVSNHYLCEVISTDRGYAWRVGGSPLTYGCKSQNDAMVKATYAAAYGTFPRWSQVADELREMADAIQEMKPC